MKGYKVFSPDWTCREFQYKPGETYSEDVDLELCKRGFHFCEKLSECFSYYSFNPENKVAEVIAIGKVVRGDNKCCTNKIKIGKELTWTEVLEMVNDGKGCTGLCNTGNWNTGNWNTGDWNTGLCNTGNCNTGAGTLGTGTPGTVTLGTVTLGTGTLGTGTLGTGTLGTGTLGTVTLGTVTLGTVTLGTVTLGTGTLGTGTLVVL